MNLFGAELDLSLAFACGLNLGGSIKSCCAKAVRRRVNGEPVLGDVKGLHLPFYFLGKGKRHPAAVYDFVSNTESNDCTAGL